MRIRGPLSVLLAISLNFSLCTGGILSSAAVFAQEIKQSESLEILESAPMSFALFQYMSCSAQDDASVTSGAVHMGCKDKQTCLLQTQHSNTERTLIASIQNTSDSPTTIYETFVNTTVPEKQIFAMCRSGPLFESCVTYAHSLQKRE